MTVLDRIRGKNGKADVAEAHMAHMREQVGQARSQSQHLEEMIAELELMIPEGMLDEPGWQRLTGSGPDDQKFTREFLDAMSHKCRVYAIKSPWIKRAVEARETYVWGQGVNISASGPLNEPLQRFLDARGNRRAFSSQQAQKRAHRTLETDGNVFFRFFVNSSSGAVKVRGVPFKQIRRVITNPDDASEPWFYVRDTRTVTSRIYEAYPDLSYRPAPAGRADFVDGDIPIKWDTPLYHVKQGDFEGMDFGIPAMYAALDWAQAYREFLADWKKLVHSLQRWAWKQKTGAKTQAAVDAAKEKIDSTLGKQPGYAYSRESNPSPTTGAVAVLGDNIDLEPIKTGGATIAAEDGRQLLLAVCAATSLPETFFGDVSVGSLATAKSLDRPTELVFAGLQKLWGESYADIFDFVLDCSARAPSGLLHKYSQREDEELGIVILGGKDEEGKDIVREVHVEWPPLLERDVETLITAFVEAVTLGGHAAQLLDDVPTLERIVLGYLNVEDADEIMDRLHPTDGTLPETEPTAAPASLTPQAQADGAATESRLAEALVDLRAALTERTSDGTTAIAESVAALAAAQAQPREAPVFQHHTHIDKGAVQVHETVNMPEQEAPVVNVASPVVNVAAAKAPVVTVNVPEAKPMKRDTKFTTDESGHITGKTETETEA
jgi:hypothetical protein